MYDFFKSGDITEAEMDAEYGKCISVIENLELKNMLGNEEDVLDAVLNINSGAGGTESNDWADMLYRMYTRWAEDNGYKVQLIDRQDGDSVGIKSVTMSLSGEYAYGYLKG